MVVLHCRDRIFRRLCNELSMRTPPRSESRRWPRPAQGRGRDLRQIFEKCDVANTLRHLQQFAKSAPSASALTRSQVFTFVNRIADVHPSNYIEISRLVDALGNGDEVRDYRDLGSGLTVLCAGDSKTKISSAFGLLARTRDSTSFVTRNDVERYLVAVYKVVFLVDVRRNARSVFLRSSWLRGHCEIFSRKTATARRQIASLSHNLHPVLHRT